jgi:hypothetical protein
MSARAVMEAAETRSALDPARIDRCVDARG